MKQRIQKIQVAVFIALMESVLTAGPLYIGRSSWETICIPEDTIQTNSMYFSTAGVLNKTGAGTWSVPLSLIGPQADTLFKIRRGNVAFLPPGEPPEVHPPEVLNRAAFWVDARTNVLTTVSNDTAWVDAWLDVRETGSVDTGYVYGRAVPDFVPTNAAPILTVTDGMDSIWFGGYQSGRSLRWKKASGENWNLKGIRHVFAVHGAIKRFGFLFGTYSYPTDFHIADTSGNFPVNNSPLWCTHGRESPSVYSARTFVDGGQINPFANGSVQKGFHLLEVQLCGGTAHAENFFNDRNYFASNPNCSSGGGDRIGGESLCEVLVFTNVLSEIERLDIETWLMRKWFGTVLPRKLEIELAKGTEMVAPLSMFNGNDGEPYLITRGAGLLSLPSDFQLYCKKEKSYCTPFLLGEGDHLICPNVSVRLKGGDHLAVREEDVSSMSGPHFSVEKTAAVDSIMKSGDASACMDTIPVDVKTLSVTSGSLALTAPVYETEGSVADEAMNAMIPNPGFETWPTSDQAYGCHDIAAGDTYNGWTAAGTIDSHSQVFFFNGRNERSNEIWSLPLIAPEGNTVLAIKKNASVWTQITIPVTGVYRLSLRTNARRGREGLALMVAIGKDASSLVDVAVVSGTAAENYETSICRFPCLDAGSYQLWFKNAGNGNDNLTLIDDVRLTFIDTGDVSTVSVPNGTFERPVPPAEGTSYAWENLSTNNQAVGWTLMQRTGWTSGEPSAAITRPQMSNSQYYNLADSKDGNYQLMFSGAGGSAETTFTPPAGIYWLRADVCCWRPTGEYIESFACMATVFVNGVETSLGSLTASGHQLTRRVWPASFTVPEGASVTLRLTGPDSGEKIPRLLADNFELVRADMNSDDCELIVNGGFESSEGWTITKYEKSKQTITGSQRYDYSTLAQYYGYARYEGKCWISVVQKDCIAQEVNFPRPGLYRFAFHGHARADSPPSAGRNPVRLWWSDGTVTNVIGMVTPYGTNFVEYAFNFEIPRAGAYTVGLMGSYAHDGSAPLEGNDHTTVVDGVSLKAVPRFPGQTLPDVPGDLTLQIASGAKVRLDYSGTLSLSAVQIASRSVSGEISAVRFPDFFEGPGKIYVKRRGFYLMVR